MPKIKNQTEGIYLRLSDVLLKKLDVLSTEKGMNRSEYLRYLIQTAIEREENKSIK